MATGRIGTTPALGYRWSIEPAGGTTSLSGLDANSVGLTYTPGNERVYRNGVLLSRVNDYTATSGNSITLIDATIAGDIIEVFSQDLTQLADTIAKSQLTAKGQILTATAASTPATLAVGTNNHVLTADSATATGLKWAALPASGGMTLIAATASNGVANITFSSIPSTYKHLLLVWDEIENLSSATQLEIRLNNATSNYTGMDIKRAEPSTFTASAFTNGGNVNNSRTDLATGGQPNGGHLWVYDYASTTRRKVYSGASRGYSFNFTGEASNVFNGYYRSTTAITSLEFRGQNTLGNGGEVRLYGVN